MQSSYRSPAKEEVEERFEWFAKGNCFELIIRLYFPIKPYKLLINHLMNSLLNHSHPVTILMLQQNCFADDRVLLNINFKYDDLNARKRDRLDNKKY